MRDRRFGIRFVAVALASVLAPVPAVAQTDLSTIAPGPRRVDISGSGGFLLPTDWSDLVLLGNMSTVRGALEQVLVRDLAVRPGPMYDAIVTYWEGRYGFRTHVGFAKSCLTVGPRCGDVAGPAGATSSADVNTWMYDVGGAIGLVEYRRGRWTWPYVFFGFGGVTYDLERTVGPPLGFIDGQPPQPGDVVVVARDDPEPLLLAIDELGIETRFAVNLGVGADVRIPSGPASVGLRLEVADNLHRSPIGVTLLRTGASAAAADTRLEFGFVHNLRASAGLVVQFGR